MMTFKKIFILLFSPFFFVSCVTLTPAEHCALIGQTHVGTNIGTRTRVTSNEYGVFSHPVTSYNPICGVPKTDEERKVVSKIYPIAQEKQNQKNIGKIIYAGFVILVIIVFSVATSAI